MIRLPNAILFLLIFVCIPGGALLRAQVSDGVVDMKMLFADSMEKLEQSHGKKTEDLAKQYVELLESVKSNFQKNGNLDAVLRLETEQQAARAGEALPVVLGTDPLELTLRRGQYNQELASLKEDCAHKVTRLRHVYVEHLKLTQSILTRANRITEAIAVQNEVKAMEAASLPQVAEPSVFPMNE